MMSLTKSSSYNSRWVGKKWGVVGDSITAGAQVSQAQTYWSIASPLLGIPTVVNHGISGTCITSAGAGDTSAMSVRYTGFDFTSDIISVFGGTNDFGNMYPQSQLTAALTLNTVYTSISVQALKYSIATGSNIQIGGNQTVTASAPAAAGATTISITSFTANGNYAIGATVSTSGVPLGVMGDTVNTTFYGAMDYLIKGVLTSAPAVRLVFFTPVQRGTFSNHPTWGTANTAGVTLQQYVDAIISVCNKYGIPVLDLFRNSGITTTNMNTWTGDQLHPNPAGHARIGGQMASFINNLSL